VIGPFNFLNVGEELVYNAHEIGASGDVRSVPRVEDLGLWL